MTANWKVLLPFVVRKRREEKTCKNVELFFFEKLRRMWSMTILYLDDANFLLLNVSYIWMKCMCS